MILNFGEQTLVYLSGILIALILRPLARKTCLSYPALLVMLSAGLTLIAKRSGFDIRFHSEYFKIIVEYLFLPTLIFQLACAISLKDFTQYFGPIIFLGIGGVALGFIAIALISYHWGFPNNGLLASIVASLLAGISATALIDTLNKHHIKNTAIKALLRWEALLSSILAISIFNILLGYISSDYGSASINDWVVRYFQEMGGGILIGLVVGSLSLAILMLDDDPGVQTFVTIASVYFAFVLSQNILQVSGVVAVATQGLLYHHLAKPLNSARTRNFIGQFWNMSNLVAYTCSFLLVGLMLDWSAIMANRITILLLVTSVILIRMFMIYILLPGWRWVIPQAEFPPVWRSILFWGGTRGAIPVVLALTLPDHFPQVATIQAIIYGVTTLGLLGQIPLSCWRAHRMHRINTMKLPYGGPSDH